MAAGPSGEGNYYSVLGLDPAKTYSTDEIKKAYRRQSLKTHPDVSKVPDAKEKFLRVQEAYRVLSDPRQKANYGRRSTTGGPNSSTGGYSSPGNSGQGSGFDFDFGNFANQYTKEPVEDLSSIFSDLADQLQGKKKFDSGGSGIPGFFEEFVDFLEKQTGSSNTGDSGQTPGNSSSARQGYATEDLDVLESELEDANFVLDQLRARQNRLIQDLAGLKVRAGLNPDSSVQAEARRLEQRTKTIEATIAKQQNVVNHLISAVAARKAGSKRGTGSANTPPPSSQNSYTRKDTPPAQETYARRAERTKKDVADELERMKREMGI